MPANLPPLPSSDEIHDSLCKHGDFLTADMRELVQPPGLRFTHPTLGDCQVTIDVRQFLRTKFTFAEEEIRAAFPTTPVRSLQQALGQIRRRIANGGVSWGISGSIEEQRAYGMESKIMRTIFEKLPASRRPNFVVDNGSSTGVPAINGFYLGVKHGYTTIGFVARERLGTVGRRSLLIAGQHTALEAAQLVGILPDLLVCIGGEEEARYTCGAALEHGNVVVLLNPRRPGTPSFMDDYRNDSDLAQAQRAGQLFVCDDLRGVGGTMDYALSAAERLSIPRRGERLNEIEQLLTGV